MDKKMWAIKRDDDTDFDYNDESDDFAVILHTSIDAARERADTLAADNPGDVFTIYEAVEEVEVPRNYDTIHRRLK